MLDLMIRVLDFALPILLMIFLGLFGTGLLIELGLMQKLTGLTKPLIKHTNLPEECGAAFVVSLGSTFAANSMIVKVRDNGCISDRQTMLCAILNSTPAYIREILTYQIPIVLPALGFIVGGFYVGVFILTAIVKISVIIILSRIWFEDSKCTPAKEVKKERPTLKKALSKIFHREKKLFTKIAIIYLSMTTLVFALRERGAFEIFSVLPLAEIFGIPPESIVPLTTYVASPILGVSLLGPMIGEGSITYIQAMIVLMLGSMFMLPIFAFRTILPRYVALFGPKLGAKIVTLSTGISIIVRFCILVVLLMIAR
ncbi:nucleoside recognition domain-containing protein [Methanohalophilus sp.]|uniref:nucleoside recognition domain-containing protein n=1 Tax=Methanohalophilus sp. TaxID=1966352 RepID=UPI00262E12D6|nr:nucleoside recognition domain-containing protein [Methanohalophilus sp.]MDK2892324.1 hypothetical protein [Methanohalophilus sp.]